MVEQRKSFPQAVPSSICTQGKPRSQYTLLYPPKPQDTGLLLWAAVLSANDGTDRADRSTRVSGKTYVVAGEVVDAGLGKHGVV